MARIMITVNEEEKNALCILAKKQFRDPRDQAALIIRQELVRRGLLTLERESSERQRDLSAVKKELA